MDPDATLTVAQGTFITSVAAATIASAYGTVKGHNLFVLASSTSLNSGIAAATFFSCREYIVSPILLSTLSSGQFLRRSRELEEKIDDKKGKLPQRIPEPLSWSEMRMYKLPDTAASGALAGGVLNAWKRGPAGIASGAITATLLCSLLQLGYNELGVIRVKYVSRKLDEVRHSRTSVPGYEVVTLPPEPSKPLIQRMLDWMGMPQISDEDYLQRLRLKRANALQRIAEIEAAQARGSARHEEPRSSS